MRNDKDNLIVSLSLEFALEIVKVTTALKKLKHFQLASQLFRSGTSIGANIYEAQNAESKADFIHKMKIAAKEADETTFWLTLCNRSADIDLEHSLDDLLERIIRILSKIISTSKKSSNHQI